MGVTPEQAVDVIHGAFGRYPGARALHAKGSLLKGTFTATPEAAALTRAAHMQGEAVPVTFRFSNGSGNPQSPDWAPDPRGMSIKMYLPDGSRTDIVAVTNQLFPTRTPDGFVDLLKARSAGPAAAVKVPLFLLRHPEALRVLRVIGPTVKPPESYALIPYWGIHAFKWIDPQGGERWVRYTLLPERTAPRLSPKQARQRGNDYLRQDIRERVEKGPVRFTYEVEIAGDGDRIDDPTAAWPKDRERVQVGTFEITGPDTERETGGDVLVFDPTRVTDGIEPSNDPVLQFRPKAYSVSIAQRTAG
jgi:catalase